MNWEQEYIMETYELPFLEKGLLIKCGQDTGKITGFKNGKVKVKLDNGKNASYHPTWEMIYFDENNNVLADFTTGDKNNG
ncbi:hypothetical protein ACFGW1_01660 [Pasteurella multocida]